MEDQDDDNIEQLQETAEYSTLSIVHRLEN